jgi:hypothetical protein
MAKSDDRFAKKDEGTNEALNEWKAIITAFERKQTKLAQTNRESAELFEEKTQTRQHSQHCQNELYGLSAENTANEITADDLRRFLER